MVSQRNIHISLHEDALRDQQKKLTVQPEIVILFPFQQDIVVFHLVLGI